MICARSALRKAVVWVGIENNPNFCMSEKEPNSGAGRQVSLVWSELRALLDLVLDFSFRRFITPRLIRILYALSLLAALLAAINWMVNGFNTDWYYGLFTVVTGPIAFVLYVLLARVVMELVLAIFQIAEHTRKAEPPAEPIKRI